MPLVPHVLAVALVVTLLRLAAASPTPLSVCDVATGFAGESNFEFLVNTASSIFDLRQNEAIIFVLRPLQADQPLPLAAIHAHLNVSGAISELNSDSNGILQIRQVLSSSDSLSLTVVNNDKLHSTAFKLLSFHANHPSCTIALEPSKVLSLPLITQIAGTSPSVPATFYFHVASPPPGAALFTVDILNGLSASSIKYAPGGDPVTANWLPLPARTLDGSALPLYLSVTPLQPLHPSSALQIMSLNVVWAAIPPEPTQAQGPSTITVAPTPKHAVAESSGFVSTLGSMLTFLLVLLLVYLIARTAYNIYSGERRFPRFIPHHEEMQQAAVGVADGVQRLLGRGRAAAARRHTQYEDVPSG